MKKILVSQQIYCYEGFHREERDCLDLAWMSFLLACDLLPIIVPNNEIVVNSYLNLLDIDGILLTGGNDAAKRLVVENILLAYATSKKLPLIGVCHGMQMIQRFFDIPLESYPDKDTREMEILIRGKRKRVNSYHTIASKYSIPSLHVWAETEDGWVKAISHQSFPIHGIMWHPEREPIFCNDDIHFFKQVFLC